MQNDGWNCGCAQLLHFLDFYLYQVDVEYPLMDSLKPDRNHIIQLADAHFQFGRSWRINRDEASLLKEDMTRGMIVDDFFKNLLINFRREMIQSMDDIADLLFVSPEIPQLKDPSFYERNKKKLELAHEQRPFYVTQKEDEIKTILPTYIESQESNIEKFETVWSISKQLCLIDEEPKPTLDEEKETEDQPTVEEMIQQQAYDSGKLYWIGNEDQKMTFQNIPQEKQKEWIYHHTNKELAKLQKRKKTHAKNYWNMRRNIQDQKD